MTDYFRTRTLSELSAASDYSRASTDEFTSTTTPTKRLETQVSAATTGTTVELGNFTALTTAIISNEDTSNFVFAEFYTQVGAYAAGNLSFNGVEVTDNLGGDWTTSPTFAKAGDWARVATAEDTANDGLHLVVGFQDDGATNDLVEFSAATTTNVSDTSATISFERRQRLKIPPSSHVVVHSMVPAGDLVLTADTAACVVTVLGVGT